MKERELRLDLALQYASELKGRKVTKKELACAIFLENKSPYLAFNRLEKNKNVAFSMKQINRILNFCKCPINVLIQ